MMNKIKMILIIKKMSENFEKSIAFSAACDLVFKGRVQPSGYTEPLLHKRLEKKIYKLISNWNSVFKSRK